MLALQTAHAQSGMQRSKALATDVAQNKLDELRSRKYNDLRSSSPHPRPPRSPRAAMDFTVVSALAHGVADRRADGCSNQRARDYMSLKTTVTWAEMGDRKPVVLDTLVAAPVGAGGGLVVSVPAPPARPCRTSRSP